MQASPAKETVEEFAVRNGLEVFVEGINIEIGEKLGEGGQADVNKAKLIPSGLVRKINSSKSFRELVAVKQYENSEHYEAGGHEGIVKLLGVYATSVNSRKQRGIVLEYCTGGSLDKVIKSCAKSWYYTNQISWIEQIFKAVKHIHDLGIIHRDLKPANILFTSTDLKTLKICDFSDCTTLPKESAVVEHTSKRGTRGYRATEIEAEQDYGDKADVFSLGRTILCILCRLTPEEVEQPFFKFLCGIVPNGILKTVLKTPAAMDNLLGLEDENMKKLSHFIVGRVPELATLAANMYSPDIAKRPKMDGACVRLQEILDDAGSIMNDTMVANDKNVDFVQQRMADFMKQFWEITKGVLAIIPLPMTEPITDIRIDHGMIRKLYDIGDRLVDQLTLSNVRREDDIDQMSQIHHQQYKLTLDQAFQFVMQAFSAPNITDNQIFDDLDLD